LNSEEFDAFRHAAVHNLMDLNEECKQQYRITDWPRWDYDLDAGTLIFSEEGIPKVITSIQVVGTTSTELGTWLWGWANNGLPSHVTERVHKVREFGEAESVTQLIEQEWPDDEYLGWAMTAIAARIIGAKGAYRCPRAGGGFIYMVYTDLRLALGDSISPPQSTDDRTLTCDVHGTGEQTYVCEHLLANPRQEWYSDLPTEEKPWPDAWCAKCDHVFQEQGEWNEHNEGRIKIQLLCHHCYESFRRQESDPRD